MSIPATTARPDVTGGDPRSEYRLRVLLVDDQDDVLNMMRLLLERRSYAVSTANSAHQALKVAPAFEPHVVISDISMPGMDGYQLMAELRAICREFRSIALTGYGMADDHQRAMAAGYDAHLTKPVDFDALFATIDEWEPGINSNPELRRRCFCD